ncbi:MAG: nucleotidyltransferase [Betaproteobacteria bacterium]|nr:nucleotidyltransferase [Betaproteobacteria bacterium]
MSHRGRNAQRTRVAQVAAGLIADGLTDYHAAKHKAAQQLGLDDRVALPDNQEIEQALREHLALFQRDSQPQALQALRETALRALRRLQVFSPWLTGAVLNGTANQFSEIELELIGVEAKEFELFLLNNGVEFRIHEERAPAAEHHALRYHCDFEQLPLVITLYDNHTQRQALHPRGSVRHERAQLAEAEKRFLEEPLSH